LCKKKKISGLRPEPQQGALPLTNVSAKIKNKNFPFCFFFKKNSTPYKDFVFYHLFKSTLLPLSILEKHHGILIFFFSTTSGFSLGFEEEFKQRVTRVQNHHDQVRIFKL
jgi:hypothetical protein